MDISQWEKDYMLIKESLNGNESAWDALYRKTYPLIRNYIRKISLSEYIRNNLADDIANEAFERCYKKRAIFEARSSFSTWVCGFARYIMLEHGRLYKTCYIYNCNIEYYLPSAYEINSPELIAIKREQYKCLSIAFSMLSSYRRLLIMCYILGYIKPKKVIELTKIKKYCDRMCELQIALDIMRRYYLFLYEGDNKYLHHHEST